VRKNAEQMNLTGICIFNPNFNLVYVEGATKFIRNYTRLMLQRIPWTEAARPRGDEQSEESIYGNPESRDNSAPGVNEAVNSISLENNRCDLVWEGEILERTFLAFRAKNCPTDVIARDVLGPKLTSRWDVAKNWRPQDEEIV
jgi:U4/U6 small nuclear ribonucleoprotein PRP3